MNPVASATPSDQPARDRVVSALDTTIFVEAGAGSGKTHALVDRVLSLIDSGVDVTTVAAITFTERAAGELRDRIRRALRDSIASSADDQQRALRETALENIDDAAIGTLHGFARRLLAEHPIEAGLPITFTVRDEVTSSVFERSAWADRADALHVDPSLAVDIRIVQARGVDLAHLRQLGESLDTCWDRITPELFAPPEPIDFDEHRVAINRTIEELCAHETDCLDESDKLLIAPQEAKAYANEIDRAKDAEQLIAILASEKPTFKYGGKGRKDNWVDIDAVRAAASEVVEARAAAIQAIVENSLRRLICVIAEQVVKAAELRQATGMLSFDDLLVLARRLLIDNPGGAVREQLHQRYTHILLDEFQDTDPLQVDIAMRLTADPADGAAPGELVPLPGRLFTVGDPKQSIYAFRGADLALYLDVNQRMTGGAPPIGEELRLTTNFRTVGPVIDWINAAFARIITERASSQPAYAALESHRGDCSLAGPAVVQLGADAHPTDALIDEIRVAEAQDIAAVIVDCMGEGAGDAWQVEHSNGDKQPARLEDISILLPTRTSLPRITEALDAAQIPFRTESSGLVYASPEVRALISTLRAIDDPDDSLSLVTALRSMLFGCGDDDLLRFREELSGSWAIFDDLEDLDQSDPVVEAIGFLGRLARQRNWSSPAALLEEIVRERRLLELGRVDTRPRDLWRRVRFVIDQARSWSAGGGGALGDYIVWAESQMDDSKKVSEAILPETDDDAVRLLTIHASKGLEFPIVICAGLTNQTARARSDAKVVVGDGRWDFSIGSKLSSGGLAENRANEKDRDLDERKRLLYVACTRARDHLVVSVHRAVKKDDQPGDDAAWTIAEASEGTAVAPFSAGENVALSASGASAAAPQLPEHDEWQSRLDAALEATSVPDAVAVTQTTRAAAAESEPEPADDPDSQVLVTAPGDGGDETAEILIRRAHGGTAFGRAVHGALQTVDLNDPDQVEVLARAQCHIEGIPGALDDVITLVRNALASPILQQAAGARTWPELWVCGEHDGTLLEGVIDLLFETEDGLVIVDYKTDARASADFEKMAGAYREQVVAYAGLVRRVTGREVVRGVLLHLGEGACVEYEVELEGRNKQSVEREGWE